MAPSSPPTEVILRVKVLPGHIEGGSDEFTIGAIYTHLNIGAVRQRIQQLLPSNPAPERQRLLYAGRALVDNEQTIADALNTKRDTSQTEYVIHLLVKGGQENVAATAHRRVIRAPGTVRTLDRAATPTGGAPGLPQADGFPQLHQGPPHQAHQLAVFQQRQAQMHHQMMEQQRHGGPPPGAVPLQMPQMPQMPVPMPMGGQMPQYVHVHQGQPMPGQQVQQPRAAEGVDVADDGDAQQPHSQPQQESDTAINANDAATPNLQAGNAHNHGAPGRPVSGQGFHMQGVGPNGNRFEIHQQTLNFPLNGLPGQQQLPFGFQLPQMPGMGLPFPMPGMAQHHQHQHGQGGAAANVPSALDRARQNVTEMRQMVDDMRNANATEEERVRMTRLEEHINAVNDYIDPFRVGRPNPGNAGARSASPFPPRAAQQSNPAMPSLPFGVTPFQGLQARGMPPLNRAAAPQQPSSASDVTCYLLSSPTGPQALLFSPQHGQYNGSLSSLPQPIGARSRFVPRFAHPTHGHTPTQPPPADLAQDQAQAVPPPDPAIAQIQNPEAPAAAPAAQDPLQPLLAHFWLLFRVMIFAYFVLGANMGWRRPVALMLIGLGFWMIRAGLFGENGVARRWWEGIVQIPGRELAAPAAGEGVQAGQAGQGGVQTPEQLAQRLIAERQARLNQAPLHRVMRWAREEIRPVERAAALFLASLWPGIGEAHVRAREEEERRRTEEEVERRRVEEEERVRAEEAGRNAIEAENGENGEKDKVEDASVENGGNGEAAENSGEKAKVQEGAAAVET